MPVMEKKRLAEVETYVLEFFRRRGTNKLPTRTVFDETLAYANADLVRAFEDMEKKGRVLIRYTDLGEDWLLLTADGAKFAGLKESAMTEAPEALPHPPQSIT